MEQRDQDALARQRGGRDLSLEARVNFDTNVSPAEQRDGKMQSRWLIITRTPAAMGPLAADARWRPVPSTGVAAWTDDFSNILSVFFWSGPRQAASAND